MLTAAPAGHACMLASWHGSAVLGGQPCSDASMTSTYVGMMAAAPLLLHEAANLHVTTLPQQR